MKPSERLILFTNRLIATLIERHSPLNDYTILSLERHRQAVNRTVFYDKFNCEKFCRIMGITRHTLSRSMRDPKTVFHDIIHSIPHYETIICNEPPRIGRLFDALELAEWLDEIDNEEDYINLWLKQKHNRLFRKTSK